MPRPRTPSRSPTRHPEHPRSPVGAVLVLHGGASRGDRMMVSPTQLSVIQMVPTARAAARAGQGRLAVYRLLNTWRSTTPSGAPTGFPANEGDVRGSCASPVA